MFGYLTASLFVPQSEFSGPTNPNVFGDAILVINIGTMPGPHTQRPHSPAASEAESAN